MASIRDLMTVAIVTALDNHPAKPPGWSGHRQRARAIHADELPATAVYVIEEQVVDDDHDQEVERELVIGLEHRVKAVGESPDAALDPLLVMGTNAVLLDPTLGGLAIDTMEVGTEWAAEERDATFGAALQKFKTRYITKRTDQESQ